ncbi:transglycosylase SLT domain-containing protein [Pseudomonas sp. UL073]|uniref:Transglycosylase SLT domain-containing protein n=1 Tax=Zestomonas insulae TaxID=2809017 RepID=A0ABS2IB58_9GAMM|nr:transglycosylase SLT domain-containing protein [Pseudomonas insulae]MBM7059122.1 transglycosylase SLT domain-containing protein [Pseudomonas insulae]
MSIVSLSQHLDARRNAGEAPATAQRGQLEVAAEQFEALFLQQILKQMRKASDVLGAGSPLRSRESDTMRDFYDEVLAENLAGKKQTGIADLLVKQLGGGGAQPDELERASAGAREAELPQRPSMSVLSPLVSAWQRGVDRLGEVWQRGSANFQALVDSVIQQESSGRFDVVSAKGARGLMQLMPDTAREVAADLGIAYDEARLTTDAAYNKRLGTAYLGKMLDRYDQHPALALAAYNAGPARVDEWLQQNGDPRSGQVGVGEWIERIPFQETRDYTRRILRALPQASAPAAQPLEAAPKVEAAALSASRATVGDVPFKSPAATVALQERTPMAALGGTHQSRSAAFAQPIRIERKETVS